MPERYRYRKVLEAGIDISWVEDDAIDGADMPELYHAKGEQVYHNWEHCPVGSKIPTAQRESGTGGMRLCKDCAERSKRKAQAEKPPTFEGKGKKKP
jgi:hypothetical protein